MAVTFSSSVNLQGAMQIGMATFTPAALFSTGEQGAWYDPSDNTTMFTTSNGTTQVTAVETAVGLILDKSKGLTLGSELVTNGTFNTDLTGWTTTNDGGGVFTSTWNNGNALLATTSPSTGQFSQGISVTAGKWYKVTANVGYVSGTVNGNISIRSTNSAATSSPLAFYILNTSANTSVSFYYLAASTTTVYVAAIFYTSSSSVTVDNISVKEIPGNHAYQSTDASRPILRSRYNLLTYSEEFDNAAWSTSGRLTVSANTNETTDPLGGNTADKITETVDNGTHRVSQASVTPAANTTYVASVYIKKGTRDWCWMLFNAPNATNNTNQIQYFNLSTLAKGQQVSEQTLGSTVMTTFVSSSISDVGNGWRRVTMTCTAQNTPTSLGFTIGLASADGTVSYAGSTSDYGYIWGAQLTQTAVFPSNTYQRIAASTDYATGAAFPQYLSFDGTDDSLLTASVDFTGTDKMTVWSGVTKQSDAATGMLSELSDAVGGPNGHFSLVAPSGAASNYAVRSKGTGDNVRIYTTYTAPITNVVFANLKTTAADSADAISFRVNGVENAGTSSTSAASAGNFGNYPLYIGRRNNATLPFNGRLYSLIVRGAATLSSEVASTEQWVAAKTPLGSL